MSGVALAPGDIDAYRTNGFVVLRQVFSPEEVAASGAECDRLMASGIMHPDNLRTHVLGSERPPDRLDPVVDVSPLLRELAADERILARARLLLDDEPSLFKDKVIFKQPGTRGYKCHQDFAYWHWLPAAPDGLLTVMVALDPATAANGAVEFFGGHHDRLLTDDGGPADVDESLLRFPGDTVETSPGDVVMFHSLTPHRSGDNRTQSMRRQMYLSYNAARWGDLYDDYYQHLHESVRASMDDAQRARAYFR